MRPEDGHIRRPLSDVTRAEPGTVRSQSLTNSRREAGGMGSGLSLQKVGASPFGESSSPVSSPSGGEPLLAISISSDLSQLEGLVFFVWSFTLVIPPPFFAISKRFDQCQDGVSYAHRKLSPGFFYLNQISREVGRVVLARVKTLCTCG